MLWFILLILWEAKWFILASLLVLHIIGNSFRQPRKSRWR